MPPLISALCPTYARPPHYLWLLEESVYWFLRQDWPAKELLILNDDPGQVLVCDSPGVRVLNLPVRCPSLGAKYQLLLEAAKGEYAMLWEDDDVSLPHRMRQAAEHLRTEFDFWNPQSSFFQPGATAPVFKNHSHGVCLNASAFRTAKFRGAYPAKRVIDGNPWVAAGHANQDAIADSWAKENLRWNRDTLIGKPELWSFVYRFGVTPCHFSGMATAENAESVWRAHPGGKPGTYFIEPKMRMDYGIECAKVVGDLTPC